MKMRGRRRAANSASAARIKEDRWLRSMVLRSMERAIRRVVLASLCRSYQPMAGIYRNLPTSIEKVASDVGIFGKKASGVIVDELHTWPVVDLVGYRGGCLNG